MTNLVLYDSSYTPYWTSNTWGSTAWRLELNATDGILRLLDIGRKAVWVAAAGMGTNRCAVLQPDSNLVVYERDCNVSWALWE
ncbi:hypothetical protein HDU96_005080 [Phlyctochytrium bullatum]|nr:hypothetical protein HDU96_005080 [Phlyctochytrium bullatum]